VYSIVVYLREAFGSEVVIRDGLVGREVVALEAEGADLDLGGEVGIVVFGWYNYIT